MKIIAFDCFGTVFDMSNVPKEEMMEYGRQLKEKVEKIILPKSWENIPAWSDSKKGIDKLREKYFVCTLSNGPLGLIAKMSKNSGINWDAIIPLELNKVYKPNLAAYETMFEVLDVKPEDCMMVSANKNFGDIEAARELGMKSKLIRQPFLMDYTIIKLAEEIDYIWNS